MVHFVGFHTELSTHHLIFTNLNLSARTDSYSQAAHYGPKVYVNAGAQSQSLTLGLLCSWARPSITLFSCPLIGWLVSSTANSPPPLQTAVLFHSKLRERPTPSTPPPPPPSSITSCIHNTHTPLPPPWSHTLRYEASSSILGLYTEPQRLRLPSDWFRVLAEKHKTSTLHFKLVSLQMFWNVTIILACASDFVFKLVSNLFPKAFPGSDAVRWPHGASSSQQNYWLTLVFCWTGNGWERWNTKRDRVWLPVWASSDNLINAYKPVACRNVLHQHFILMTGLWFQFVFWKVQ